MNSKQQRKMLFVYPENESLGIQILSAILKEEVSIAGIIHNGDF